MSIRSLILSFIFTSTIISSQIGVNHIAFADLEKEVMEKVVHHKTEYLSQKDFENFVDVVAPVIQEVSKEYSATDIMQSSMIGENEFLPPYVVHLEEQNYLVEVPVFHHAYSKNSFFVLWDGNDVKLVLLKQFDEGQDTIMDKSKPIAWSSISYDKDKNQLTVFNKRVGYDPAGGLYYEYKFKDGVFKLTQVVDVPTVEFDKDTLPERGHRLEKIVYTKNKP